MAGNRTHAVSIRDVAEAAGVSTQTVSRVLNDIGTVKSANRERVLKAIAELDYKPNIAARMLKQRRYRTIGVAMYDLFATGQVEILSSIVNAAQEAHYVTTIINFDAHRAGALDYLMRKLAELPIDGAIVLAGWLATDASKVKHSFDKPLTFITAASDIPYTTVGADGVVSAHDAVCRLADMGHRHIFHVSGPLSSIAAQQRLDGWKSALKERGLPFHEPLSGNWSADSGYKAGLAIAREPACTAVYVSNDRMAFGLIQALESQGKRVPEDISVIGTDNSLGGIIANNELSSIDANRPLVGTIAARETLAAIENPGAPVKHICLDTTIIERGSIRAL